jgi:hypothetical protein
MLHALLPALLFLLPLTLSFVATARMAEEKLPAPARSSTYRTPRRRDPFSG